MRHLAADYVGWVTALLQCLHGSSESATLARVFNLREFTAEYDRLPKRVMEPFSEGPIAGSEIAEEELSWFMHRYYELMGCHPETGEPTDECLRELGLDNLLA